MPTTRQGGMRMKIFNIENPEKFLDVIKQCRGNVELISKQGDRLNLKSELIVSEPEDMKILLDYMMEGTR